MAWAGFSASSTKNLPRRLLATVAGMGPLQSAPKAMLRGGLRTSLANALPEQRQVNNAVGHPSRVITLTGQVHALQLHSALSLAGQSLIRLRGLMYRRLKPGVPGPTRLARPMRPGLRRHDRRQSNNQAHLFILINRRRAMGRSPPWPRSNVPLTQANPILHCGDGSPQPGYGGILTVMMVI